MMLHVIKSPARAFDMIIDAEPWAVPYREALRGRLNEPSGTPADDRGTPAIEGFEAARRRASIARWDAGADTWRRWTQRIGALRARFEREFGAERSSHGSALRISPTIASPTPSISARLSSLPGSPLRAQVSPATRGLPTCTSTDAPTSRLLSF